MKVSDLFAAACISIILHFVRGLYSQGGAVRLIAGNEDFQENVLLAEQISIVEMYAPWCAHCQALAPTVEKLATKLDGVIKVYAVDCDTASNKIICGQQGVHKFPTIKMFPAELMKNPYTGEMYKDAVEYEGPSTPKAIADAAYKLLPTKFIVKLEDSSDLEKFSNNSNLPKALLATMKAEATPLYKSLSLRFKGRMEFAVISPVPKDLQTELDISALPALLIFTQANEKLVYSGKLKAKEVTAFLEEHALPTPATEPTGKQTTTDFSSSDQKEKATAAEQLELSELQGRLSEVEEAWLVAVFGGSNDTCAKELGVWNEVADELGRLTSTGTIFLSGNNSATATAAELELDVDGLTKQPCQPQILLMPFGDKGDQSWPVYQGELNAKELQQFVLPTFPSRVLRVTGATMPQLLGVQPHRPKLVLVTAKDQTPQIYAALSANFAPRGIDFFDVHSSDVEAVQQLGTKKVPAVVVAFLPPQESWEEGEHRRLAIQPYVGPLKYAPLAAFLENVAAVLVQAKGSASPISIEQVSDESTFEQKTRRLGLCVIVLLDKEHSPDTVDATLSAVATVAAQERHQQLHFIWVDVAEHAALASQLGLSPGSIPAVVAYNANKRRYAVLDGGIAQATLSNFLHGVLSGKVSTSELAEPLTLSKSHREPETVPEELIEEEFDLADILSESVSDATTGKSKADTLAEIEAQLQAEEAENLEKLQGSKKASQKKRKGKKKKKTSSLKTEL